jgi:biotin transport system substrate-specific component
MPNSVAPTAPLAPTLAGALWPARGDARLGLLRALVLAFLGSSVLTLSAKVQVPFYPVPMTMQTLVVLVIGAAYGWRLGAATLILYLVEGALGLPVFAGTPEKGSGIPYMLGPTGGYLAGFVAAAAIVGWLAERGWDRSPTRLFIAMAIGHLVIFAAGYLWLASLIGADKAWAGGVAPFYWATLVKNALGGVLLPAAWNFIARRR